nr:MAG TPA: hypothetical protein [Caudoviricetes sp.]
MPTRRCFICQDDQKGPVPIPAVQILLTVVSVRNTPSWKPSATNVTTETLPLRDVMAELGNVSATVMLLLIPCVSSALRKVCTHQPRRYIT